MQSSFSNLPAGELNKLKELSILYVFPCLCISKPLRLRLNIRYEVVFLVLLNSNSCFYDSIDTKKMVFVSY